MTKENKPVSDLEIALQFYESQLTEEQVKKAKETATTTGSLPYVEALIIQYKHMLRNKYEKY